MSNDPHLSGDTCTYMEAVSGDGGNHNASVWWLSPDIVLNGPTSGPDKADPGVVNPVQVKFHRLPDESNCVFSGGEAMTVELWVGNPSIAMAPNTANSTRLIQAIGSPVPLAGATGSQVINWTPPSGVPSSDPESPGHKCLIARCYPDNLTPDAQSFHVPDDQHVAQRNICIVPCDAPGAARRPGPCTFHVNTINVNREKAERVTLRARADVRPTNFVRENVLRTLERFKGFRRLAVRPPRSFRLDVRNGADPTINDHTRPGCLAALLGLPRTYSATVTLEAGQLIVVGFEADLFGAEFGDAYVFHLTQAGPAGEPQGGLTLVMVV